MKRMWSVSRLTRTSPALLALLLCGCGVGQGDAGREAGAEREGGIAFTNVNVIPMDSQRVLRDQVVLVQGDRIVEVGNASSVEVPRGAIRVDGTGKYLMPGIAEMHGHVFTTDIITEEVAATFPELYVLTGVTTVRTMAGSPWQFELKDRIASGELLGPHLYTAGPSLNGQTVESADHGRQLVREYHAAGYDLLKVHPGLTREVFDAIMETADELGIRVAGHVSAGVGIRRALEARQGVDHLDGYYIEAGSDESVMAELAEITATQNVYNAPTMDLWKSILGHYTVDELMARDELKYMLPAVVEQWAQQTEQMLAPALDDPEAAQDEIEARNRMLLALYEAGAKLMLGSDSPQIFSVPGFSLTHELPAMIEAGIPVYGALEAATRNSAEYFDDLDEYGTVTAGKRADLILLHANPLDDIRNVHRQAGVMVRGQWIPEEEIRERLASIEARVQGH